jgi:hypothetical protein
MKITSDLTNLTTAILILTVQMFIEWTLVKSFWTEYFLVTIEKLIVGLLVITVFFFWISSFVNYISPFLKTISHLY